MAIAKPQILMIFNDPAHEASGAFIPGYGTVGDGTAVNNYWIYTGATVDTDFTWNPGAGLYGNTGYLHSLTNSGASSTILIAPTVAAATETIGTDINFLVVFNFDANGVPAGGATQFFGSFTAVNYGDVSVYAEHPGTGGGDFNLFVTWANAAQTNTITQQINGSTGLNYGTTYYLSGSLNGATASAYVGNIQLNGGGGTWTQTSAGADWTGGIGFVASFPRILRRSDDYFAHSMKGSLYAIAYHRAAGVAWTTTDLANINANPNIIPGWPGAVSSPSPPIIYTKRNVIQLDQTIYY